jgi:glycosyltransferase involved in cell wall biosynthesis
MKIENPTVTIIIPTKNNGQTIDACMQSILHLDYPRDKLQVIVVDSFSKDSTHQILRKYPIEVIKKHCNAPTAYNLALKYATGEIIGFVDGDAKVAKDWLKSLVNNLGDSLVAGAGGLVLTWNDDKLVSRCIGYELTDRYEKMPRSITRICTTNLVLRKTILEEVGGFDENLPTGYDADIGDRIISKGYKILFDPRALVYHYHRPTIVTYFRQQFTYAKYDVDLYSKRRGLMARDNVTRPWMIIQPFLLLMICLSWVLSVFSIVFYSVFPKQVLSYSFLLGLFLMTIVLSSYIMSGFALAKKYHDLGALFLIPVLDLARSIAWTLGGIVGILNGRVFKKVLENNARKGKINREC